MTTNFSINDNTGVSFHDSTGSFEQSITISPRFSVIDMMQCLGSSQQTTCQKIINTEKVGGNTN